MPRAFAYFSNVERRISSAWFSMREIADFFVRSFFAIVACVTPAHSRACRSMMLNSNASYPDSKSFANFELRTFRFSMYRSTSLMTFLSLVDIRCAVVVPVLSLFEAFFAASSQIHSSGLAARILQRTQEADNFFHQSVLGFPKALQFQQVSSSIVAAPCRVSQPVVRPMPLSVHAHLTASRETLQLGISRPVSGRIESFTLVKLTHM